MPKPTRGAIHLEIYPPISLVRKRLAKAMLQVKNWKGAWWGIARAFYAMEKRAFATEGSSQGKGWAALKPGYRAWKEAHHPGKPKLQLTGDLMKSLTSRNADGAFYESTFREFAVGTILPAKSGDAALGVVHQQGRDEGPGKMPARPPLVLDEKFMVATREIMVAHMMRTLKTLDMPLGKALSL